MALIGYLKMHGQVEVTEDEYWTTDAQPDQSANLSPADAEFTPN